MRRTIGDRCEFAAELVNRLDEPVVVWCHYNPEGDLLTRLIDGAVQVKGSDSPEVKEDRLHGFSTGKVRVLVTKPKIGAWGLNWQHCSRVVYFPSHSYEQYYQAVRRCWRFGQERSVRVDVVTTEAGSNIMENLRRKAVQADEMFTALVAHMSDALTVRNVREFERKEEVPSWL